MLTRSLVIILIGSDFASNLFVSKKIKKAGELGIEAKLVLFAEGVSDEKIVSKIKELNESDEVRGIMVQLPIPGRTKDQARLILDTIDPVKDVDCLTTTNLDLLEKGTPRFYPAAVRAVIELLEERLGKKDLSGKTAVVLGNSDLVGRPLTSVLRNFGAQVKNCDINTPKEEVVNACRSADILVSATGVAKLVTANMVKKGSVVIDVGMNRGENGKLVGDVDYENVSKIASYVSPVPGGVGPRTVQALLDNFLDS